MDLHTFIVQTKHFMSHPVIKLFVMPLTFLLVGMSVGSRINGLNILGSILLYLFMVCVQLIEQYLFSNITKKGYINWEPLYVFYMILSVIVLGLFLTTNVMFLVLILAYVIGVHLMYALFQLKGTIYHIILQVFLKGFVMTIMASFVQVNVITPTLLLASIPVSAGVLFYYAQIEKLDVIKYGEIALSQKMLTMLSVIGFVGAYVTPFVLGKISVANFLFVIIWGISGLLLVRFATQKKRYIKSGRSKNYLSALYTLFIVLLSLV